MPRLADGRCVLCGVVRSDSMALVEHFVFAHEDLLPRIEGEYGLGLGWIERARRQLACPYLADPFDDSILNAIPRP